MKRLLVASIACLAVAPVSVLCFAAVPLPIPSHSSDHDGTGTCFVVAEATGLDVSCVLYTKLEEVKQHMDGIPRRNKEITDGNKAVKAEIEKLQGQLASKSAQLSKAADENTKAELQKEVDSLKQQIADKKAELKPTIRAEYRRFGTREQADKWIEQVNQEGERKRAQAEKKKETNK